MKPKFKTTLAWEQAQILMQPAYIRVVDNLRKQLETSGWKGQYQEVNYPLPGYKLVLTQRQQQAEINIWELCFQVCFSEYNPEQLARQTHQLPEASNASYEVEIDTSLLDEKGEVAWERLEEKTQGLVRKIFANLTAK